MSKASTEAVIELIEIIKFIVEAERSKKVQFYYDDIMKKLHRLTSKIKIESELEYE